VAPVELRLCEEVREAVAGDLERGRGVVAASFEEQDGGSGSSAGEAGGEGAS